MMGEWSMVVVVDGDVSDWTGPDPARDSIGFERIPEVDGRPLTVNDRVGLAVRCPDPGTCPFDGVHTFAVATVVETTTVPRSSIPFRARIQVIGVTGTEVP